MQYFIGVIFMLFVIGMMTNEWSDVKKAQAAKDEAALKIQKAFIDGQAKGKQIADSAFYHLGVETGLAAGDSIGYYRGVTNTYNKIERIQFKEIGIGILKTTWPAAFGYGLSALLFLLVFYVCHDLYMPQMRKAVAAYIQDKRYSPDSKYGQLRKNDRETEAWQDRGEHYKRHEVVLNNAIAYEEGHLQKLLMSKRSSYGRELEPVIRRKVEESKSLINTYKAFFSEGRKKKFQINFVIDDLKRKRFHIETGIVKVMDDYYADLNEIGLELDRYLKIVSAEPEFPYPINLN